MPANLTDLNQRFAIAKQLEFTAGPGEMPIAQIDNQHATAQIALNGAHVYGFQPHGQAPVLWLSSLANFAPGKPIRGGIPVIWPWFGPHPTAPDSPMHGFVRKLPWEVIASEALADGGTRVQFGFSADADSQPLWPHLIDLTYTVTVGEALTIELVVNNQADEAISFTDALHTYFQVGDVAQITLFGLEETDYLDKVEDFARKHQQGPIRIDGPTDRVYVDTATECVIDDPALGRRIHIRKAGSDTTVVWNPWIETAKAMADFRDDEYPQMLCVESANAANDVVVLEPGESHRLKARIAVE